MVVTRFFAGQGQVVYLISQTALDRVLPKYQVNVRVLTHSHLHFGANNAGRQLCTETVSSAFLFCRP